MALKTLSPNEGFLTEYEGDECILNMYPGHQRNHRPENSVPCCRELRDSGIGDCEVKTQHHGDENGSCQGLKTSLSEPPTAETKDKKKKIKSKSKEKDKEKEKEKIKEKDLKVKKTKKEKEEKKKDKEKKSSSSNSNSTKDHTISKSRIF